MQSVDRATGSDGDDADTDVAAVGDDNDSHQLHTNGGL